MQQRLTAANGGLVLANGMAGGPVDPFVNDPYNLGVLDHVNGIENERQVNPLLSRSAPPPLPRICSEIRMGCPPPPAHHF